MMPDQPSPILVRHAARDLPERHLRPLHGAPLVCTAGAAFVDELFRERRISSVEWRALRDAIWPTKSITDDLAVSNVMPSRFHLSEAVTVKAAALDRAAEFVEQTRNIIAGLRGLDQ